MCVIYTNTLKPQFFVLMAPYTPLILLFLIVSSFAPWLASGESPPGFLSIDVGSTETSNYTDPTTGIVWTPDTILWPQIAEWSTTSILGPPSDNSADQKQYQSFRYFKPPQKSTGIPSPTKFCYSLPAQANKYYLIRVSFWCSTNLTSASTRVGGALSFYIIIDSYVGPRIDILLPQTSAYVEEYYVQALNGSTSVNLCLSGESDVSDAPFVNSIELRPLVDTLSAIKVLKSSNSALRGPIRYDLGAADKSPPIIRYK